MKRRLRPTMDFPGTFAPNCVQLSSAVEVAELRERVLEELVVLDAAIGREEGGRERRREGGQSLDWRKKSFLKKKSWFREKPKPWVFYNNGSAKIRDLRPQTAVGN